MTTLQLIKKVETDRNKVGVKRFYKSNPYLNIQVLQRPKRWGS